MTSASHARHQDRIGFSCGRFFASPAGSLLRPTTGPLSTAKEPLNGVDREGEQ